MSFDVVSERLRVVADASIARHDCHELGWLAKQLRCRQVHAVHGTNRFDRKRTSDADEDGLGDFDNVAPPLESLECSHRLAFFLSRRDSTGRSRSDDRAAGFRKRQRGGHALSSIAQPRSGRRVALEKSGDHGA